MVLDRQNGVPPASARRPYTRAPCQIARADGRFLCPGCRGTLFKGTLGPGTVIRIVCRHKDCPHHNVENPATIVTPGSVSAMEACIGRG